MSGEEEDKPQTGKKIFANNTSDKELLFKIYKEIMELNSEEMKTSL